jgi:hypothetical protein
LRGLVELTAGFSFFADRTLKSMKKIRDFYNKYKDYSLDLVMYGTFIIFLLILFIFFS